jgi:hypothetical protein
VLISPICRWWNIRASVLAVPETSSNCISVNHRQPGREKKLLSKAVVGRGPKRTPWVEWLYKQLLEEFDRLRKAGVKFSPKLLLALASDILKTSEHPEFSANTEVNSRTIQDHLTYRWIQHFMNANNVVGRRQTGKLMVSPEKTLLIEKQIAYHLGTLSRKY